MRSGSIRPVMTVLAERCEVCAWAGGDQVSGKSREMMSVANQGNRSSHEKNGLTRQGQRNQRWCGVPRVRPEGFASPKYHEEEWCHRSSKESAIESRHRPRSPPK